jgi:hypothetical protein
VRADVGVIVAEDAGGEKGGEMARVWEQGGERAQVWEQGGERAQVWEQGGERAQVWAHASENAGRGAWGEARVESWRREDQVKHPLAPSNREAPPEPDHEEREDGQPHERPHVYEPKVPERDRRAGRAPPVLCGSKPSSGWLYPSIC